MRLAFLAVWLMAGLQWTAHAQSAGPSGNPAHDAILARSPADQRTAFRDLLRTNRLACADVAVLFPAGLDATRTAYWDVSCTDGGPWRIALPPGAAPRRLNCGQARGPGAGACFQPIAGAMPTPAGAPAIAIPQGCHIACSGQPEAQQANCLARCATGSGVRSTAPAAGPLIAATGPFGTASARRGSAGFIYAAEPPSAVFGFSSGRPDRAAASTQAIRACEAQAGRNQCRLALDFPNACGALAQAVTLPPVQVRRIATGVGQTREQAEAQALQSCRGAEAAASPVTCRIAVSGC